MFFRGSGSRAFLVNNYMIGLMLVEQVEEVWSELDFLFVSRTLLGRAQLICRWKYRGLVPFHEFLPESNSSGDSGDVSGLGFQKILELLLLKTL